MRLPRLVEIVPAKGPLRASIPVPGSKSMTNRALILAARGKGVTQIQGALWSDDTQVMVDCLRALGYEIEIEADPGNEANRKIRVQGGPIRAKKAELYVGNAGTTARFICAFCATGEGDFRIHGDPRMHERPMKQLFRILGEWGVRFTFEGRPEHLPVRMKVVRPLHPPKVVEVDTFPSSQFASALELVRPAFGYEIRLKSGQKDSYFDMTKVMASDSARGFRIEPDASSATYFWAAESLIPGSRLEVLDFPKDSLQVDANFRKLVAARPPEISRASELGDSGMMAVVLGSLWPEGLRLTGAARMRQQETDRLEALRVELVKCGAKVRTSEDEIVVEPNEKLHGARIDTYQDHRMAMAFAVLGLRVPGIQLRDPSCVAKTFPNFFETLERTACASGVGSVVLDAVTGKPVFGQTR